MVLITIEGVYENGRVLLEKRHEGVQRANVVVTFLSEGDADRMEVSRTEESTPEWNSDPSTSEGRYPNNVREEYRALLHKKLHRSMTADEEARLEAVRTEINQAMAKSSI